MRFYTKDDREPKDLKERLRTRGYVGKDPALLFYKKYKKLDRISEFDSKGYSATTAYLIKAH